MDISVNQTLNIAKVCHRFATYDVQLPDIYQDILLQSGCDFCYGYQGDGDRVPGGAQVKA